jgi:hypothetical protein
MARERNSEIVVELLRPLLMDLHVQRLDFDPVVVRLSNHRKLIVAGMGRCIVVARKTSFLDDTKGCLSFSYDKTRGIFLFIINVNAKLFANDLHDSKVERKAVAIHEFVHCASALLLLSSLGVEAFIRRTASIISNKVKLTTSDSFNSLLAALRELG